MAKQDKTNHTTIYHFRLSDEINDLINRLARHLDVSRTDVVRLGVRKLEENTPGLPAPEKKSAKKPK
jgi:hypothetical protein